MQKDQFIIAILEAGSINEGAGKQIKSKEMSIISLKIGKLMYFRRTNWFMVKTC